MEKNDFAFGLILGGVIGVALAMLFAPKSGQEMRQDIRNSAASMLEKTKEKFGFEGKAS